MKFWLLEIWTREGQDERKATTSLRSVSLDHLVKIFSDYLSIHRELEDYMEDDEFIETQEKFCADIKKGQASFGELNCAYILHLEQIEF